MNTGNSFLFGALFMAIELFLFTELGEHFFPGSLFEKRSALFLSVASLAILRRYGSMPTAILAAASLFLCLAPDLAFVPLCAVLVGSGLPVDNCLLLPASEFYVFSMMAIFVWLLATLTLFCNVSGTLRLATAFSFLWFCHRLPLVAAGTNGPTDDQVFLQLVGTTVVLGHAHNESRKRTRLEIDDKPYTPTSFDDRQITVRAFSEPPVKYTGGFATPAEDETPTSQYDSAGRPYHPKFLFLAARDATLKLLAARQLMFANQHPSVSIKAFDYVSAALAIELGLQHRSKQHHDTFVQRFTTSGVKLANVLRATAM